MAQTVIRHTDESGKPFTREGLPVFTIKAMIPVSYKKRTQETPEL